MTPRAARSVLLQIEDLSIAFPLNGRLVRAVDRVSLCVHEGETVGLVGESGCGKSVTALAVLRLVPPPGRIDGGHVWFRGRDLLALPEGELRRVRGAQIGLVFQEPLAALNPVFPIGRQVAEPLVVHGLASGRAARQRAIELLAEVRVPDPERRLDDYPHQLSGGLQQRVLVAIALACRPALLIADEPTTALDVTIQAQILDLLRELQAKYHLAVLLITHDLGVVAETAERLAVMYAGRIVEDGPMRQVLSAPQHPYTRGLIASMPGGPPRTRLRAIEGTVPMLGERPPGCTFAPRCPERFAPCELREPDLYEVGPDHRARCFLHDPRDGATG